MGLSRRLAIGRLDFSRILSVSVCLCAFTLMPLPQISVLTGGESAEKECPCEEKGESAEEELVFSSSACRRWNNRRRSDCRRPRERDDSWRPNTSFIDRRPVVIGHQLSNGLCAPLLI